MEIIESFVLDHTIMTLPFYVELAGITYADPTYEIKRENSWINVLEYVTEGSGTVHVDGNDYTVRRGDVYLLPIGSSHRYCASKDEPFTKIWMNVSGDLCTQLIQIYKLRGQYYFHNIDIHSLFEKFLDVCKNRDNNTKLTYNKCSLIFMEIIQQLSAHIEKTTVVNESVAAAKHFCDNNIYERISAVDAARKVGLSVSQLNRLFRKEYSTTVYAYILSTKINTAKALLSGTSMAVKDIAFMLNFADEHYFTNIFKHKTGRTPTEWRKACYLHAYN
jgi:AraC family transcriptional regulator, arabinose operon regulatory protein